MRLHFLLADVLSVALPAQAELLISEYVEGSSNNKAIEIYNPKRRIGGRGWPRTVQVDANTVATLFYDLSPEQSEGPGLYAVRTQLAG